MATRLHCHLIIFCALFLQSLLVSAIISYDEDKPEQPKKPVALFIFGDSFLDTGNNNYLTTTTLDQANFWPYGETYFNFPTGRFSDGRLVSDFIAEYANLPLVPPYLQPGFDQYHRGVNFASGGAGALVETFKGDVIDLKKQLSYYREVANRLRHRLGNDETEATMSTAVFLFSIGSNDYTSQFLTNSSLLKSHTVSEYVGMVIGNLTEVIREIYEMGGRKFAFINLPPLGCIPVMRVLNPENNGGCWEQISLLAGLHNKALARLLYQLEKQLKGFKYSLFDMNTNLEQRIKGPSMYDFKHGKTACCGTGKFRGVYSCGGKRPVKEFELCPNPNEYVFWDSFHLTESAYKQLADQMWNETINPHANGPFSLKELFQLEA